jgi:hypothetical protein
MTTQNLVKKTVKIKNIIDDDAIYPREQTNWHKILNYKNDMEAGCKFPPIKLGSFNKKLYLVDGEHRIQALKQLGIDEVDAEIQDYTSLLDMKKDAAFINSRHGLGLNRYDQSRVYRRFKAEGVSDSEISRLLGVPVNNFNIFIDRVVTKDGRVISIPPIIAQPLRENRITEESIVNSIDLMEAKKTLISKNAEHAINQVIFMLQNNLIAFEDDATKKLCIQLYELLAEKAIAVEATAV